MGSCKLLPSIFFQGTLTLTIQGINSANHTVSTNLMMSLHTPGQILVVLPGVFLPQTFTLDMQPVLPLSVMVLPMPTLNFLQQPAQQEVNLNSAVVKSQSVHPLTQKVNSN